MRKSSPAKARRSTYLRCTDCGNEARFVEIMEFESHLVDGRLNYIRLLDAGTDYYLCARCHQRVEEVWNPK